MHHSNRAVVSYREGQAVRPGQVWDLAFITRQKQLARLKHIKNNSVCHEKIHHAHYDSV